MTEYLPAGRNRKRCPYCGRWLGSPLACTIHVATEHARPLGAPEGVNEATTEEDAARVLKKLCGE